MSDPLAVLISFVYVFVVLGVAEALRKVFALPVEFTRKVVHIGVGMWAFGTVALFTSKWAALICPASFIVLNYISYKRGLFLAMESNDRRNLGTVYFPIAFVVLIILLFDVDKRLFVASLMPMTWGDSFAAIIGKRFGKHTYTLLGSTRSVEGSAAMLILSFISLFTTFVVLMPVEVRAGLRLDLFLAWALLVALGATAAEAVSPHGLDNLIVPATTALLLFALEVLALGLLLQ